MNSYLKKFIKYATLSVLGTLGFSCYVIADTFFISKGLGTNGLAALNLALPLFNFINGSGLMIGMGGAVKYTISRSKDTNKESNTIFMNSIYLGLVFGLVFVLIGVFNAKSLAILLGANSEILEMTTTYLRVLLLFAPAFIMNNILLCYLRNDQNPTLVTVSMLTGSFSNIILDYIFIFILDMGIFGAILATGLSPVISIVVMSLHWFTKKNSFNFKKAKIHLEYIKTTLSIGVSSLIDQIATAIAIIVFNALILNLEGNVGVAAYGVVANIAIVIIAIYNGIGQGLQPLISDSYGKGNEKNMKLGLRYALFTMLLISIILYLSIYIFASDITSIFNNENNQQLQTIAVVGLKVYFSGIAFVGFNTILANFFTASQKTLPAQILSLLRGLILIIPIALLFAYLWQMLGIWLTYPFVELVVAIIGLLVYRYYFHLSK